MKTDVKIHPEKHAPNGSRLNNNTKTIHRMRGRRTGA